MQPHTGAKGTVPEKITEGNMPNMPVFWVIYIYVLTFMAGALFGSALHCLAYRMARGERWSRGRSACPVCGHTLALPELVPVFSYLFLRGRCRHCRTPISPRYIAAEALLGLVFISLLARYGLTAYTLLMLILACCLFCASAVDAEISIIPDRFPLIAALFRLAYLVAFADLRALGEALLCGLCIGGALLALSLVMDKLLKKDSLGGGDIKLCALFGLYFPPAQCLFLLLCACAVGLVTALVLQRRERPFPFGPALSIAAWLTALFGETCVGAYLSLF